MRRVMVRYTGEARPGGRRTSSSSATSTRSSRLRPDGFHYGTFKLDDGVTSSTWPRTSDDNPLGRSRVRPVPGELRDRCDEPPVLTELEEVGSFRFAGAAS